MKVQKLKAFNSLVAKLWLVIAMTVLALKAKTENSG